MNNPIIFSTTYEQRLTHPDLSVTINETHAPDDGLTLRDYFAIHCDPEHLSRPPSADWSPEERAAYVARLRYIAADAMLAQRSVL